MGKFHLKGGYVGLIILAAFAMTAVVSCSKSIPVLTVTGGKVEGVPSDSAGVLVFKGIPYAAAPVGELRWKKPQPVQPWDGVLKADHFGKIAMQDPLDSSSFYVKEFYQDGLPPMGEDCLYLNVWAPAKTVGNADAKLPVAMWIHGGAFDHGWGYRSGVSVLPETPLSFKKGSLPIRIAIIGFNSAVRHFPFSNTIFPLKIEPSTSIFTDISTIERHRSILLINDIAYATCGSTTLRFGIFIISNWFFRA